MSRSGTTLSGLRSRRARNGKAARLSLIARRFGRGIGAVVLLLWAGAWIALSGAGQRGADWSRQALYELAGKAGFTVQDILVEGRVYSDPDILRAIINIERGDPIFAFDPADAKALIERIAWVKEAHVERRLPHTLYIGLVERTPVALWQNKQKIRVIDSEGVTLSDNRIAPFKDLLIVVGEDAPGHAPGLIELLAAEPDIRKRTEAATWVGERRWDLTLAGGMTVKLPETDAGLALSKLAKAQADDGLLDKDLTVIDLREADRIVVRTKPGAVREYQAGMKGDDI